MALLCLLLLVAFSGYLANLEKSKRFNLFKALLLVVGEAFIGMVSFILFAFVIAVSALSFILVESGGSLFIVVLLLAVMNGFILYWMNRWLFPKFSISNQVQTLCEYIIQWLLIYVTVYQDLFNNLDSFLKLAELSANDFGKWDLTHPSVLTLLVLPSLISVWVGIILYKTKEDTI